jgi:DHA2 family multidrug resistance protein
MATPEEPKALSPPQAPGVPSPVAERGSYRWVVLGLVMMGTLMAILDASIVNVALPHMMSAFGVSRDDIEWVSTAFMLATAVAMPLVGWLASRLNHRRLYLGSLALFTAGSAACAFAWSYDALIAARVIQAVGGGAIQPVGMAIVADLFEPHERGRALGIWGTGIMVGPALGPTLGGYLTDWFNWRVIFSVNLPFGALTLLAGLAIMRREAPRGGRRVPFDAWGFAFLSLALVSGLLALANGQDEGWHSSYVTIRLALAVAGLVLFLAVESSSAAPLLDLSLFRIHNFSLSMALAVFRSVGLFGGVFLLPIFLENLVGYTTIQTGLWMMPGAVAVGLMMPVAGQMADRYQPRWLVAFGALVTGVSLLMYGDLDPLSGPLTIIGPQVLRGAGLAFMMSPLITAAINAVPRPMVATASSFLNVAQRVGGAFGIALLNTIITNAIRVHAVRIGARIPVQSVPYQRLVGHAAGGRWPRSGTALAGHARQLAARAIQQRATVMGFQGGFVTAGLILLASLPLCLLLRPLAAGPAPEREPQHSPKSVQDRGPVPGS